MLRATRYAPLTKNKHLYSKTKKYFQKKIKYFLKTIDIYLLIRYNINIR